MIPWAAILSLIVPVIEKVIPDTAAQNMLKAELSATLLQGAGSIEASQAQIIAAEAQSEGWLTRNWRPIAMLNFLGLLNLYWIGYAPAYLTANPALVGQLFQLLTVGIGGYIGGRTLEKAGGTVAAILTGKQAPASSAPDLSAFAALAPRPVAPSAYAPALSPAPPAPLAPTWHQING